MSGQAKDIQEIISALFAKAQSASERAYSPYSGARVGACVLDDDGNIYSGCNVENASYGLTQCAECNALANAINAGMQPGKAHSLLVFATGFDVLAPCGACRQVMSELMADEAVVISCVSETDYRSWKLHELLPDPFVLT
jgi:cytidine deaminase